MNVQPVLFVLSVVIHGLFAKAGDSFKRYFNSVAARKWSVEKMPYILIIYGHCLPNGNKTDLLRFSLLE